MERDKEKIRPNPIRYTTTGRQAIPGGINARIGFQSL